MAASMRWARVRPAVWVPMTSVTTLRRIWVRRTRPISDMSSRSASNRWSPIWVAQTGENWAAMTSQAAERATKPVSPPPSGSSAMAGSGRAAAPRSPTAARLDKLIMFRRPCVGRGSGDPALGPRRGVAPGAAFHYLIQCPRAAPHVLVRKIERRQAETQDIGLAEVTDHAPGDQGVHDGVSVRVGEGDVTAASLGRGSHIAFTHPNGYAVMHALIARGVIGDFREPDVLRFGLTPLYLSHQDVWRGARTLYEVMESGAWRDAPARAEGRVT